MPIFDDWTIGDLVEWIAADDGRCHDEQVGLLLAEVLRTLSDPSPHRGATVVRVRRLAELLRETPSLRAARIDAVRFGRLSLAA